MDRLLNCHHGKYYLIQKSSEIERPYWLSDLARRSMKMTSKERAFSHEEADA